MRVSDRRRRRDLPARAAEDRREARSRVCRRERRVRGVARVRAGTDRRVDHRLDDARASTVRSCAAGSASAPTTGTPTSSWRPRSERHEHVLEGMEAGADDYLTKPIAPFDLRDSAHRRPTRDRAAQAGRAVPRRARAAQRELAEQARTDPLTGLGNRMRLHEDLSAYARCAPCGYDRRYCFAICDLD